MNHRWRFVELSKIASLSGRQSETGHTIRTGVARPAPPGPPPSLCVCGATGGLLFFVPENSTSSVAISFPPHSIRACPLTRISLRVARSHFHPLLPIHFADSMDSSLIGAPEYPLHRQVCSSTSPDAPDMERPPRRPPTRPTSTPATPHPERAHIFRSSLPPLPSECRRVRPKLLNQTLPASSDQQSLKNSQDKSGECCR